MKKGFTLIELLVVMWIIWVLTAMTMSFGGDSIKNLRQRMSKAVFVNTFEQLRSNAINSNYYNKQIFKYFSINLQSGSNSIWYSYHIDDLRMDTFSTRVDKDVRISNIKIMWQEQDEPLENIWINVHPYELSCDFGPEAISGKILRFDIKIENSNKRYCFIVRSSNCKLTEKKCKDLDMEEFRDEIGFSE